MWDRIEEAACFLAILSVGIGLVAGAVSSTGVLLVAVATAALAAVLECIVIRFDHENQRID